MSAVCTRLVTASAGVLIATLCATACGTSDLLVGDDTRDPLDGASADTSVLPDGSPSGPDASRDASGDAPADARADVMCPELIQPPPGFCDSGPYAPKYNGDGCIIGFGCAPLLCTDAGGTCVALVPGACPSNHTGDASKYSCGSGIGVQCCLP